MRLRRLLLRSLLATLLAGRDPARPRPPAAGGQVRPALDRRRLRPRALARPKRKKIPIFVDAVGSLVPHVPLDAGIRLHRQGPGQARRAVRLALDRHREGARTPRSSRSSRSGPGPPSTSSIPNEGDRRPALGRRRDGRAAREDLRRRRARRGRGKSGGSEALGKADALYGDGDYAEGRQGLREALAALSPKSAGVRARRRGSLSTASRRRATTPSAWRLPARRCPSCAHTASGGEPSPDRGLDCALALPADRRGPRRDDRRVRGGRPRGARGHVAQARRRRPVRALRLPAVRARRRRGTRPARRRSRPSGSRTSTARRRAPKTADQRTALDPDRLTAFEAAGQIEKAIPMLEASAEGFPGGLQPAGAAGPRLPEAQAVRRGARGLRPRARAACTGPASCACSPSARTSIRGWATRPRRGRPSRRPSTYAEALPPGQRSEPAIAALKKQLEARSAAVAKRSRMLRFAPHVRVLGPRPDRCRS